MKKLTTSETLRLGIEATRGGLPGVARQHLVSILKAEPDNIPALLWLAYVTPNLQDSLRLLNHVLALDPNNEPAKAGIHWARRRLGMGQAKPISDKSQHRPKPTQVGTASTPLSKTRPTPRLTQKKLKRKSGSSRSYYAFRIALAILVVGLLGITIGVGASIFIPAETLAAWLPVATVPPEPVVIAVDPPARPIQPVEALPVTAANNFASTSDTVLLTTPQSVELEVLESDLSTQYISTTESSSFIPDEENLLLGEAMPTVPTEPLLLIGPALSVNPTPVEPSQLTHQPAYPGEKWIEVNVTTQEVTAWEGNVPVLSFISSTGLPNTPTVLGEYNIYWKLEKTLMTGDGYYLPDVPYTMYFYQGYALHGTYWHENFGQPMSRGCVNLSIDNSRKLFEWADPVIPPGETDVWATPDNPGTLVVVHQ